MCGLCGIAGRGITSKDLDIFQNLLTVCSVRGQEGTGVAAIDTLNNSIRIEKSIWNSGVFLIEQENKRRRGIFGSLRPDIYVGHCRAPTTGDVTISNTHPFDTGRYVSAHNGTLVSGRFNKSSKTDSQLLFEEMEGKSIVDSLQGLSSFDAFAVSIYDKKFKKLHLSRNKRRPLSFVVLKDRAVVYWASELSMLRFVLDREGEKYNPWQIMEDTVVSFDVTKIKKDADCFEASELIYESPIIMTEGIVAGPNESQSYFEDLFRKTSFLDRCADCDTELMGDDVGFRCRDCRNADSVRQMRKVTGKG